MIKNYVRKTPFPKVRAVKNDGTFQGTFRAMQFITDTFTNGAISVADDFLVGISLTQDNEHKRMKWKKGEYLVITKDRDAETGNIISTAPASYFEDSFEEDTA